MQTLSVRPPFPHSFPHSYSGIPSSALDNTAFSRQDLTDIGEAAQSALSPSSSSLSPPLATTLTTSVYQSTLQLLRQSCSPSRIYIDTAADMRSTWTRCKLLFSTHPSPSTRRRHDIQCTFDCSALPCLQYVHSQFIHAHSSTRTDNIPVSLSTLVTLYIHTCTSVY